jgi:surface protein
MGSNINIFNFVPSTTGIIQPEFIMLVKTDNAGTSASDQFTIPTTGGGYNYDVDWGDGTTSTGVTGNITHTFIGGAGNYIVKISGAFPRIFFNAGGDRRKLLEIQNWGNIAWTSMAYAFSGCTQMDVTATDVPDLSSCTDMRTMFNGSISLIGNSSFSSWDTTAATDMREIFQNCSSFNQDISSWAVQNVTNMRNMFTGASVFNYNLANWNLYLSLTNMASIFSGSGMSTANYTDTIVGWANYVFTNSSPFNVSMTSQAGRTFDTSRSGGANFADAGAARTYLTTTAGWTISGDTVI